MTILTKRKALFIIGLSIILMTIGAFTYAYFTTLGESKPLSSNLSIATLSLRFADNDNGISTKLAFGQTATKKFLIENTGTAEASLSIDWVDLVNTYQNGSLTYKLSYSEEENGEYKELLPNSNMPVSNEPITQTMAYEVSVPIGKTYYYNLDITLNNLPDVNQDDDLNASFSTMFNVGQPLKYRYYSLKVNPNGGIWETFTSTQEYLLKREETKEVSTPTRIGYYFDGWTLKSSTGSLDDRTFTMGISDTELVAKWIANNYELTIDLDGGEYDEELPENIDYDETITLKKPIKKGYSFVGWETTSGEISEDNTKFTMNTTENATITAKWKINNYPYQVIYRKMFIDEDTYKEVNRVEGSLPYGTELTPEVIDYEGFTSPSSQTMVIDTDNNTVTYDYKRNQYTLTIDSNGGEYQGSKSVNLYYEETLTISDPQKEGNTFTGWSVSKGTLNTDTKAYTMAAGDSKITANWVPNNYKYIVYHKKMSLSGTTYELADTESGQKAYGTTFTPEVKTYTGFTSPTRKSLLIQVDSEPLSKNVLTYNYSRNQYTLTVDLNGGSYPETIPTKLYYGQEYTLKTPTRKNYTFIGWTKTAGTSSSIDGYKVTMGANNTTVQATWQAKTCNYTVLHKKENANDTGYTLDATENKTGACGTQVTPGVKTYTATQFSTPSTQTITLEEGTTPTVTYNYPRKTYTLTIIPNGGTYNGSSPLTLKYGQTTTIGAITRTGYTNNWSISGTGSTLSGTTFTMGTANSTLTANWTARTFSVTFNANGGSTPTPSKTVTYNSTYGTLPTPTYNGYNFLGWFTASSGGTQVTASTKVTITGNQTLFAHWKKIDSTTILAKLKLTSKGVKTNFDDPATTDEGIFEMQDDYGTSYYFRGAVTNNYVKYGKWNADTPDIYVGYASNLLNFREYSSMQLCQTSQSYNYNCTQISRAGKDMWWRIIRINGDGSVRMIYDGTQGYANGTNNANNADKYIKINQAFNVKTSIRQLDDAKYVGWMYGPAGGGASTSKEQAQSSIENSDIKTVVDTWYKKNIVDTGYGKNVSDTIFCNDRSTLGKAITGWSDDTGYGYGSFTTYFGASLRTGDLINKSPQQPIFVCPQKNDAFTVDDTKKGNGALTYPVGLITVDEIKAAGSGNYGTENLNYYLYRGTGYMWSLSPYRFSYSYGYIFNLHSLGMLYNNHFDDNDLGSVAPVINLTPEYANTMVGTGTITDPYRTA